MANTTVEMFLPSGLTTPVLKLFARGSDTLLNTGGDTLTERTNAKGIYTATVTEALTGNYRAIAFLSGGTTPIECGRVYLQDDTGAYSVIPDDGAGEVGGPVITGDVVDANVVTVLDSAPEQVGLGSDDRVLISADSHTTGATVADVTTKTGYSLAASQTFNMTGNIIGNLSGSVGSLTGYVAPDNAGIAQAASDALSAATNAATAATHSAKLIARLGAFTGTGVNTVLGMFRALFRSDATTPSDIGGTYDPATDSAQAVRDRGDQAWAGGGATAEELIPELVAAIAGTPISPRAIVQGTHLDIYRADSYQNSEGTGRVIPFTKNAPETHWPTTLTSVSLTIKPTAEAIDRGDATASQKLEDIAGTVSTATGSGQACYFELTSAQTAGLAAGANIYEYWVRANTLTHPATLRSGTCTVRPDQTA